MEEPYPIGEERRRRRTPDDDAPRLHEKGMHQRIDPEAVRRRDVLLGPTQRSVVGKTNDPESRPLGRMLLLIIALAVPTLTAVVLLTNTSTAELPKLAWDVATMRRGPWSAQDNAAAAMAGLLSLVPLTFTDYTLCAWLCPDSGARWFLLHAIGNLLLFALCIPDVIATMENPPAGLSVEYCRSLGVLGCSDWPTVLIVSMHIYHMIGFQLDANDLFHHLLFIPTIGGISFVYPLGTLSNVLCVFISGLPGGIDYLLLAMVKAGKLSSYTEKRVNCSINTWLRGPGITAFCALAIACWMRPLPGTPKEDIAPWYVFLSILGIVFFNGQYYAQRVIGNYYIRKAQDYSKRGVSKVELHAS